MKKFAWTLLVSISFCFLSACGGGGGGDSGASSPGTGSGTTPPATGTPTPTPTPTPPATGGNTPTVLLGLFLDSAVVNIKYKTATQPGTTNALGQFNYVAGETVTFSVGSVTLPPTLAAATITPMSLANTTDMGNNTVLNLLVFLQSLDDDGIPGNGIKIPETAHAAATTSIDFNVSHAAFRTNPVFTALVANSGSAIKSPVTLASAIDHFKTTLAASNIVVQDPRPVAVIKAVDPVMVGKTVVLDGAGSTDPKSAKLTYIWGLKKPLITIRDTGLSDPTSSKPTFAIDASGSYEVSLTVSNGTLTSATSTVVVNGINNVFGNTNLLIYGKGKTNNQATIFIGCLTCDADQPDSVCKPDGDYGWVNSASSIWNINSDYGGLSAFSPWNPGTELIKTPLVFNSLNDIVGIFTANEVIRHSPQTDDVFGKVIQPDPEAPDIKFLDNLFAAPTSADARLALCTPAPTPTMGAIKQFLNRLR
jgi:hypothetical protein